MLDDYTLTEKVATVALVIFHIFFQLACIVGLVWTIMSWVQNGFAVWTLFGLVASIIASNVARSYWD